MAHWLYATRPFKSKIDGSDSWELTFVDIDTGVDYRCYVSTAFRNFSQWREIVYHQPPAAIFQGLKFKKSHPDIISADSRFTWINCDDYVTLAHNLEVYWENNFE